MSIRRLANTLFAGAILVALTIWVVPTAVHGQGCDPVTGCEPGPGEKEKKPRPTETPLPTSTPTLVPTAEPLSATLPLAPTPVMLEGGESIPDEGPSKPGDILPLWLVPVALIGVAFTGGFWWYRRGKGGGVGTYSRFSPLKKNWGPRGPLITTPNHPENETSFSQYDPSQTSGDPGGGDPGGGDPGGGEPGGGKLGGEGPKGGGKGGSEQGGSGQGGSQGMGEQNSS